MCSTPNANSSSGTGAVERRDGLVGGGDHDEARGRGGDDLLARVGAAAALDQPALRVDLVGTVDRDVELCRGSRGARAAGPEIARGLLGGRGGGHAAQPGSSPARRSAGSRWATVDAGAEADAHAVLDQLARPLAAAARFCSRMMRVLVRRRAQPPSRTVVRHGRGRYLPPGALEAQTLRGVRLVQQEALADGAVELAGEGQLAGRFDADGDGPEVWPPWRARSWRRTSPACPCWCGSSPPGPGRA